jgi:hypothetical protein
MRSPSDFKVYKDHKEKANTWTEWQWRQMGP